MERLTDKIKSVFEVLKPLPKPEVEENKFLGDFHHLSQKEIRGILILTTEEVKNSRKFGLKINNEILEKEEFFFLKMFDDLGGIDGATKQMGFEDAYGLFSRARNIFFEKEAREYFEYFSKKGGSGSNNTYQCHLESVQSKILRAVYNEELPIK